MASIPPFTTAKVGLNKFHQTHLADWVTPSPPISRPYARKNQPMAPLIGMVKKLLNQEEGRNKKNDIRHFNTKTWH